MDDIIVLLVGTNEKYVANITFTELENISYEQTKFLDEKSVIFLCFDENETMVGCCICFRWEKTLYARVAGFAYSKLQDCFEYFNTVYYAPLKFMEQHGLQNLNLGLGTLDAKIRRGATLQNKWSASIPLFN